MTSLSVKQIYYYYLNFALLIFCFMHLWDLSQLSETKKK